jgi:uncharacterized protein
MTTAAKIDLGHLARELGLPVEKVQRTLELLDDGNTIPFITRFRKDESGGLNEEQVQRIQREAAKERLLAERKQTILRSIESQGKLSAELAAQIQSARTLKWLEDIYLPFKPRKQTLATLARERGLEPLAAEILAGDPAAADLKSRAQEFINPEKGLPAAEDVLQAVRYILAEQISERPDLRGRLRKLARRTGILTSARIEAPDRSGHDKPHSGPLADAEAKPEVAVARDNGFAANGGAPASEEGDVPAGENIPSPREHEAASLGESAQQSVSFEPNAPVASQECSSAASMPAGDVERESRYVRASPPSPHIMHAAAPLSVVVQAVVTKSSIARSAEGLDNDGALTGGSKADGTTPGDSRAASPGAPAADPKQPDKKQLRKRAAKERKRKLFEHAFKDYYSFREPVSRLPPHRVLAINRGERAKVLRVRVECKSDELLREAMRLVVPEGHPHAELLAECLRDALQRLIMPSLERELRRELTDESEEHAVRVFAGNLRRLLLQPPVRGRCVLAIDPAFRSGCKVVALDQFGNVLEHGTIHVIGSDTQRAQSRTILADLVRRHHIGIIAIGNGAACRETEQLVSDVIAGELQGLSIAYVIVNEAGASVYSTSQIGREELPHCDAVMRSAVSIGRRLLDPLSELVKINPANIGVGMYQHDVKAKHLRDSLDGVVNSCVNFVGVDVNTASPSLLSYVSGLNQLTARRLYDYRREHGPFRNREQLKSVPGIGEATFIQAAGFLKITLSDNPLDATWIHPESYEVTLRVLDRLGISRSELSGPSAVEPLRGVTAATAPADLVRAESPISESPISEPPISEPPISEPPISEPRCAESINIDSRSDQPTSTGPVGAETAASATVAAEPEEAAGPAAEPAAGSCAVESGEWAGGVSRVAAARPAEGEGLGRVELALALAANPASEATAGSGEREADAGDCAGAGAAHETARPDPAPVRRCLGERLARVNVEELSRELGIGELTLRDILAALSRPGRDPRDDFSPPPFRTGIMKLDDLKPGMELQGTVLNVVDFGAFIDIGISDSALVHISKLADRFIRDPQEVVGVGDVLKVWVLDVDRERRRVSMTAIDPHAPPRPRPQRERGPRRGKPAGPPAAAIPPAAGPPARQRPPKPASQVRPKSKSKAMPPKRPPKPLRPITAAMLSGQQPMRSFSDLLQYYEKKKQDSDEPGRS